MKLFKGLLYVDSCPSTNEMLSTQLKKFTDREIGALYTFNQTSGRGQRGNNWYTGEGQDLALSFSLQLQNFPASMQFDLNIIFSLAAVEAIECFIKPCFIKWPNDIYYKDQKLAGLLVQGAIQGKEMSEAILGIGLNVNSLIFPASLPNPVSLRELIGKPLSLGSLPLLIKEMLLERMMKTPEENLKAYTAKLYRLNMDQRYSINNETVIGQIEGITKEGKLILKIEGQLRQFNFKELEYLI